MPKTLPLGMLAGVAIIVVAAVLVYFPSISGGFVLDDNLLLTGSPFIKASDGLYRFWFTAESQDYWPVTNTSFWIEWRLWGMNTTGYHVTNLILHIFEALLIWIILRKLSIPGAFLAAMIFAVHPVNVESVAWIASRKNMMAMLFFLLAVLWYLKFITPAPLRVAAKQIAATPSTVHRPPLTFSSFILHPSSFLWYWLSLAAFVLAMLSKGSAAVMPVLLLGIIWWLRPLGKKGTGYPLGAERSEAPVPFFSLTRWDLLRIAPFFLIAVALTGVNLWFQTHGKEVVIRTAGFPERLLGAGGVVWFYIYKAFLPVNLAFVYPQWHIETGNPLWWLPLFAVLIVTTVLWRYRKTWSRPFLFAWGYFCVALVPVMGFTDVGFMKYSLVADHYQHIAILGAIALVSAGWGIWNQRARQSRHYVATPVAIAAVGALALLTWQQSKIYRDAFTLYRATLEKNPDCWLAHNNLGQALADAGQLPKAIEHYEQALRLNPDYPDPLYNLGNASVQTGRLREAIEYYRRALRLKPDYLEAHINLGVVLVQTGLAEEAIDHCKQALALKPDYPQAHNNLGFILAQTGRTPEAIEHYQHALRLKPEYPEAENNLGNALIQAGRAKEAVVHCRQALRLDPNYAEAYYNLANAFVQTGRVNEAIENYQQALRLKSNYPEAQNNLGNVLVQTGRAKEAVEHYEQALQLKPDYANAHYNLGGALIKTHQPREAIEHFERAIRLRPDYISAYNDMALAYAQTNRPAEAIATAQKALEIAQLQGKTALAKQIEDWLNTYRTSLSAPKYSPPSN